MLNPRELRERSCLKCCGVFPGREGALSKQLVVFGRNQLPAQVEKITHSRVNAQETLLVRHDFPGFPLMMLQQTLEETLWSLAVTPILEKHIN